MNRSEAGDIIHRVEMEDYFYVPSKLIPFELVVSSLLIGQGFKTSGILLVALGVTVTVFGFLPLMNFFTELPTLRGVVRKPLPRWSSRLWFAAAGALLIYWGLTQGRP